MWRFARSPRFGLLGLLAGFYLHPRHGARRRAQTVAAARRSAGAVVRRARAARVATR